jgi:hypothetical protein
MYLWDGVLFTGDSINLSDDRLEFATNIFSFDLRLNKRNIAHLKESLGTKKIKQVCTGHQGCTSPADTERLFEDLIDRASL